MLELLGMQCTLSLSGGSMAMKGYTEYTELFEIELFLHLTVGKQKKMYWLGVLAPDWVLSMGQTKPFDI